ncbi:MAG: hypothetical protein V1800_16590 [Candidatus Latescibacterota bacterium]
MGDKARSAMVWEKMGRPAGVSQASPLMRMAQKAVEALLHIWSTASHDTALQVVAEGLEVARASGIRQ